MAMVELLDRPQAEEEAGEKDAKASIRIAPKKAGLLRPFFSSAAANQMARAGLRPSTQSASRLSGSGSPGSR